MGLESELFQDQVDRKKVIRVPLTSRVFLVLWLLDPEQLAIPESQLSSAAKLTGSIDRLGLFGYRTGVLESEVIKPPNSSHCFENRIATKPVM